MKKMLGGALLVLLLLLAGSPRVQAAAGAWTQFQKDEQRSGTMVTSAAVLNPWATWSELVYNHNGSGIQNTAVVNGDSVYVFAGDRLQALSKSTGAVLWDKSIAGHEGLQIPTPAYGDGKIFIATFDGYVMAFDAQNGDQLCSKKVASLNFQCPVTYSDGHIYVGEGGTGGKTNSYFCLDEEGNLCWSYTADTAGYLWCGCSVIGGYVVFGNLEGVMASVDKNTGALVDKVALSDSSRLSFARATPGRIRASVAYHDGFVYTSSENSDEEGYLWKIGFDQSSGKFLDSGFSTATGFSTSTPVVYGDRVYLGQGEHGYPGSLLCIDNSTGAIIWSYAVDMGVKSSPLLVDTGSAVYIYFATAVNDGYLYCVRDRGESGELVWKYDAPDTGYVLQGPAADSDGTLYFGTNGGYLYCLKNNPLTGDLTADGQVNEADMQLVCRHLGETGGSGWIPEDVNGDGKVNVLDMIMLGQRWTV